MLPLLTIFLSFHDRMTDALGGKVLASRVYPEFFPIVPRDVVLHAGCGEGAQVVAYGQVGSRVIGVDVREQRVRQALENARRAGIANFEGGVADLEHLPFPDGTFDKIIAVDVLQHARHPERVLAECRRVLKPGGQILVTFPALQHRLLILISQRHWRNEGAWNPDAFHHILPLSAWLKMARRADFVLVRSCATTLFPPLHRWGVRRFWFSNPILHRLDSFFGSLPFLKGLGQAMMCIYRKA